MIKPTIHLNGSSAKQLCEDYIDAASAVDSAIEAVAKAGPNARDYYPQGPEAVQQAIDEHRERLAKLHAIREELEELGIYCHQHIR